ncbi:LOW QUALITY PROTEIN: complex I assembly factor ACAD9, mitochondrial [Maniola hyperantus]|uniref:LOW QUALITY PROTEIN: complex I assembly factor ACAD9, mitochondrial n=1 Tax=Aphantopus hyperantus TaxID=2795564 RepID=UPI00156950DE|nr:LOW QUALITY PROTEIN: complex I assembly factor ACAD9, mitochondrial [Maniola hyperantus]
MNIARRIFTKPYPNVGKNVYRKFRISASNSDSSATAQPQVQEEKFDFEDLKVLERVERRKAKIPPFMKDVFVSIYNRDLLAFPEILNKEEATALDSRVAALEKVFLDPKKSFDDRKNALLRTGMYSALLSLTNNGLAMNYTESLRYLDVISTDLKLGQEISDHWVALNVVKQGLSSDDYQKLIGDLTSGDVTIDMCIREKIPERMMQADFSTNATLDSKGVWHITGEKICQNATGYLLVLCLVDGTRFKAFLVHPKAVGVSQSGNFVTFHQTPATPLDNITQEGLSNAFGIARLYTATLCRNRLLASMNACMDYLRPRYFSGKPLMEIPTIRATIGDTLLKIYASESAEYFTAGLLDGYLEPDVDLEVAMCRNFIANHAQNQLLKLLAIPGVEKQAECLQLLEDMRSLSLKGETIESVNMFIALNGIHHAGKEMASEVKQIRNPLFNPSFIIKKMLLDRHQEKDDPKLTLYLAEHLHPTLRKPSEQLEYCVLRMRYVCETLMSRHGKEVVNAYTELIRLAEAATEILAMTAVLARASRAYCIGLRNGEVEMKLASVFVESTKERVKKLLLEANDGEYLNLDYFRLEFGKKVLESNSVVVEKPTARVFW